ncbi:glycoside hydrolase family 97 protein [uncultured Bacteroides sp.]|uniref:glycoside hydrolase family 97 protein n=1 Tax=uncultured Bacteroides sp. TaxID=162156 RepID=UPI0026349545|nr:glycoside hydrolase family 97 protein [uncultured Bacteroides sp.]
MKKLISILWLSACTLFCAYAQTRFPVNSPDGSISLILKLKDRELYYEVEKNGTAVLAEAPVRMTVDEAELCRSLEVLSADGYQTDNAYPIRGSHSRATDKGNGQLLKLRNTQLKVDFSIEARAYDDGIAFRMQLPGRKGEVRTPDEHTVFTLPAGSQVWYHDIYCYYEGIHLKKEVSEIRQGEWAAPPVTVQLPGDAGYLCLSEAALMNYAGMSLQANGKNGFETKLGHAQPAGYPFAHDYSLAEAQRLSQPAALESTITTPWRAVIIADDLNELVNSDLITNLSPAPDKRLFPKGVNTDWIKPGRSVWCWLDGGARTVEGMKEFSKLAGELGFEYNTVDAFWYRWTDEQLKDLVDYSAQYGVKIWLWRHGRDMRDPQKRKELFARCRRLGIAGLKLDAFSHESKEFIDLYQACLKEAAEHKLMLNIHGSNKPAGEVRTWPNEMSREGIRGLEYGKNQYEWSMHNTTLPFTRLVVGAGDYTPVVFGERRLETSWVHQVATALVFNSSVIFFGSHPKTMLDNPAVQLLKQIPATWDETVVLPSSRIGEVAAFARRSGKTWFLAVLNGQEERSLQFPLSFLGDGWYEGMVLNDRPADAAAIKTERVFCRKSDALTGHMRAGGGYIVMFTPQE